VYATEEPEKGKVNKEILKELSKLLHVKVELANGATSRQKQLFFAGNNQKPSRTAFSKLLRVVDR